MGLLSAEVMLGLHLRVQERVPQTFGERCQGEKLCSTLRKSNSSLEGQRLGRDESLRPPVSWVGYPNQTLFPLGSGSCQVLLMLEGLDSGLDGSRRQEEKGSVGHRAG